MAENNDIPENADKILFAEDLITFMMLRNARVHFRGNTHRYRDFVYNGFNETTRQAVRFLDTTMEMSHDDIFDVIKNANAVNHITYMRFAKDICAKYFPDGFDANHFLHYCVHLGSMAVYFYTHGVPEAPSLAVMYIVNAIQFFNMSTGGWDTLHRIAERYATMAFDSINTLSPSSNDSEEDLEQYAVDIIPVIVVDPKEAEGNNMDDSLKHNELTDKMENTEDDSIQNSLEMENDTNASNRNVLRNEVAKEVDDLNQRNTSNEVENISKDLKQINSDGGVKNVVELRQKDDVNVDENSNYDFNPNELHRERGVVENIPKDISDKNASKTKPSDLSQEEDNHVINTKYGCFSSREDGKFTELQKSMLAIRQYFGGNRSDFVAQSAINSNLSNEVTQEDSLDLDLDFGKVQASTSSSSTFSVEVQFDSNKIIPCTSSTSKEREPSRKGNPSTKEIASHDVKRYRTMSNKISKVGDHIDSCEKSKRTECDENSSSSSDTEN